MHGLPSNFWGKLQVKDGHVLAWHPLADHCADVAACCEALLDVTLLRRRLARLGGFEDLDRIQVERLCFLAALHDLGKFNAGFQNKALTPSPFQCGHLKELLVLFDDDNAYAETERLLAVLPCADLESWGADQTAAELLVATISHHGRPLRIGGSFHPRCWDQVWGRDPFEAMAELVAQVRGWFPAAFSHGSPLPAEAAFQHGWCGLITLADWLGSDTRFFPFSDDPARDRMPTARAAARTALRRVGLEPDPGRSQLATAVLGFERVSPHPQPRAAQQLVAELPIDPTGSITVLEAETGAGKTEAALLRFLQLFQAGQVDGLYFALPTRTAATQIFQRTCKAVERAFPEAAARPPVVLAVPGYLNVDDHTAERLPGFEVLWHDDPDKRYRFRGWAAENPKRYLAGAVVVGTIDQVLLSTLTVPHAHLRATSLLRHLLVVDEAHASDTYMTWLLEAVLAHHLAAGGHALLMSATLGAAARTRLLQPRAGRRSFPSLAEAIATPYPAVTHRAQGGPPLIRPVTGEERAKRVELQALALLDDPAAVAARGLELARRGARVLVLRNTVRDCLETQLAAEALAGVAERHLLLRCGEVIAPHHARFAKEDRERLDAAIEHALGKDRPSGGLLAITTQTVQQSLDLDADVLLTDLCPMDVLLQRIGRLHRHLRERPQGFEVAQVWLLVPSERDFSRFMTGTGAARGGHGLGTVYDDLRMLEATLRIVEAKEAWLIPQMNRELVERSTHPEALAAITAELGGLWPLHERQVRGNQSSQARLAELGCIDCTRAFGEWSFDDGELARTIRTRLGESDRRVVFTEPQDSPFGASFCELRLAAHLAGDAADDATPQQLERSQEALLFSFGARRYRYDRLGLRPLEPEGSEEASDA